LDAVYPWNLESFARCFTWLADVLRRIADHPASRLDELLPWNCTGRAAKLAA
jgi:hypothetical protein